MYRATLVSQGICTGVPAIGNAIDYRELDHRVPWLQLSPDSTGRDLLNRVDDSRGLTLPVISQFFAVNLYSCLPYLPAGAAFRIGRFFTGSPLTLMYLGRFANLLVYLALVLVALQLLPEFQLPLALLALMPMSLHQAASLSADAVTIATAFVLTAYILRLALDSGPLRTADYLLLLAAAIAAGLCKSNAGLMFLLLLLPHRTRWLAIAGYILLAFGTAATWQYINRPNGEVYSTLKAAAGIHLDQNAAVIFHRPDIFLSAVGRTIAVAGLDYMEQFVGRLGWSEITLPNWIPCLYLAMLAITAAMHRLKLPRLLLLAIFLFNAASVLAAFWATDTSPSSNYVIPILGRYLIPFALLPLLAICGADHRLSWSARLLLPALAIVLLVNTVALHMVWDRFDAHTSTLLNRLKLTFTATPATTALLHEGHLVRRPGTSPEDTKVYLIHEGKKQWVLDGQWLPAHGYKWPDDVNLIPAPDLAAIPEGDPIH
jgi:hypothetical protein